MTSSLSVVENGLVSSEHNKIIRRKSGRQPTSAPDQKETKGYWLCWRICRNKLCLKEREMAMNNIEKL